MPGQAKASGKKLPPASLTVSPAGLRIVNMASEEVISDLDIYRPVGYIHLLHILLEYVSLNYTHTLCFQYCSSYCIEHADPQHSTVLNCSPAALLSEDDLFM